MRGLDGDMGLALRPGVEVMERRGQLEVSKAVREF